jgi:hypothetical protein
MAFVQDSWKVNRRLSLDLGLRYEYEQPMYTEANNMANFDQSLVNPADMVRLTTSGAVIPGSGNPYYGLIRAGNGVPASQQGRVPGSTSAFFQSIPAGAPRGLYKPANTFGPRLGFAYELNSKTVMRGGYGIFYNRPEGNVTFSQVNLPPILQITEFDNGNLSNPAGGAPANTLPIGSISAINPNLKASYVEQFSYGIQRELPRAIFLETSYVGGLGRHLLRDPNINFPNLVGVAANPSYNTNYFDPYPGYTSIQQYQSDSTSNYHDWTLSGVIRLQTGPYLTVTGNTSTGTRRADYVGGSIYPTDQGVNDWVNAAAFITAPAGRHGNLGIDTIEGPGLQSYDMSVAKHFPIRERFDLRLQGDFFNAFNIANFTGLNTTITSTAFGTISSAYPPRQIQLALKLTF